MLKETVIIFAKTQSGTLLNDPPIEVGDYQIRLDGGAFENLANLPVVTAGTPIITITLDATEMAASVAVIRGIDQTTPKAWANNFTSVTESAAGGTDTTSLLSEIRKIPRSATERNGGDPWNRTTVLNSVSDMDETID